MKSLVTQKKERKEKKEKDPNAPKRFQNAYMFFGKEYREKHKGEKIKVQTIGEEYGKLTDAQKKKQN